MRLRHRHPVPVRASGVRELRRHGFATRWLEFTAASPFAVTKPGPLREVGDLFAQSEHRGSYEGWAFNPPLGEVSIAPEAAEDSARASEPGDAGGRSPNSEDHGGEARSWIKPEGVSGRSVWERARCEPPADLRGKKEPTIVEWKRCARC